MKQTTKDVVRWRWMELAVELDLNRVFWPSLAENPHVQPIYQKEGLIVRDTWRRKPAFEAYRRLISESTP